MFLCYSDFEGFSTNFCQKKPKPCPKYVTWRLNEEFAFDLSLPGKHETSNKTTCFIMLYQCTLPETNMAPENSSWKRRFLLETIIFRWYVSFRECTFFGKSLIKSSHHWFKFIQSKEKLSPCRKASNFERSRVVIRISPWVPRRIKLIHTFLSNMANKTQQKTSLNREVRNKGGP